MKKNYMIWGILLFSLVFAACTTTVNEDTNEIMDDNEPHTNTGMMEGTDENVDEVDWKNLELKDVNSGETFMISNFEGKKVLVETFAVWCPTCTKQQKIFSEMQDENVIHVSIDVDPNEREKTVTDHTTRNGFDWRYVIANDELRNQLLAEFGPSIAVAPSVPVILVCEDQTTRLLPGRGIKDAAEIEEELSKGCAA